MQIESGEFTDSEIIVMLGENGIFIISQVNHIIFEVYPFFTGSGKTTFIRMMAGLLKPDEGEEVPPLNMSYKPQKISPKFKGTVRELLHNKIRDSYIHPQFISDVMKPLQIESIIDQEVPESPYKYCLKMEYHHVVYFP